MSDYLFTGAGVALVTPFTKNGIDFEKLGELIDFQINNKTDAILICGTTGESSTMPHDEHNDVIDYSIKKINKRVPAIAGTGSNNTKEAVSLSLHAQKAGADAVLLVTPYYNKTTQEGLYQHFKAVADSISIPVILYNVPSRTGLNIEPETVYRLSLVENIIGLKECNFIQAAKVINMCDKSFAVYSGNDDQVLPMMSIGGKGIISVLSNILPGRVHKMVKGYLDGNIEESRKLYYELFDIAKSLFIEVNPIPVKEAMNMMGMNVGKCRMPLVNMSNTNKELLRKVLREKGII